jgi:hypothetical protein
VNEIALIRAQLALERLHLRDIAAASEAPGDAQARREYLQRVLGWFAARDERLEELLRAPGGLGEGARADLAPALAQALAAPGSSREALQNLPDTNAAGAAAAWRPFAQLMAGAWERRRDRIDTLLAQEPRAATWRAIAGIDADTVLEERAGYARARAAC